MLPIVAELALIKKSRVNEKSLKLYYAKIVLVTHKSWKKRDILSVYFASHRQVKTFRPALTLILTLTLRLELTLGLALAITHYELSCWGLIVFTKQWKVLSVRFGAGRVCGSSLNFETPNSLISCNSLCACVWVLGMYLLFDLRSSEAEAFCFFFTVPSVVWVIYVTARLEVYTFCTIRYFTISLSESRCPPG